MATDIVALPAQPGPASVLLGLVLIVLLILATVEIALPVLALALLSLMAALYYAFGGDDDSDLIDRIAFTVFYGIIGAALSYLLYWAYSLIIPEAIRIITGA